MAKARQWALGLAPLAVLAALVALFVAIDPTETLRMGFPPIEELTIERVTMPEPGMMKVHVVNGGPEPVTVAQVLVDQAFWAHEIEGSRTIPRLGRIVIDVLADGCSSGVHRGFGCCLQHRDVNRQVFPQSRTCPTLSRLYATAQHHLCGKASP